MPVCVCEFMHRCANLSLMGYFWGAGVSTAMCQTCLLPLPLRVRASSVPRWIIDNATNESWQVFLYVCVSLSVCGWQAPFYYSDWLRKCSSSHLAITADTEVTVSSRTAREVGRKRDKKWLKRGREWWRTVEYKIFPLIRMSQRAVTLSYLCLTKKGDILARKKFDRCLFRLFWPFTRWCHQGANHCPHNSHSGSPLVFNPSSHFFLPPSYPSTNTSFSGFLHS